MTSQSLPCLLICSIAGKANIGKSVLLKTSTSSAILMHLLKSWWRHGECPCHGVPLGCSAQAKQPGDLKWDIYLFIKFIFVFVLFVLFIWLSWWSSLNIIVKFSENYWKFWRGIQVELAMGPKLNGKIFWKLLKIFLRDIQVSYISQSDRSMICILS